MPEQTKIAHIITGLNVGGAERSLHNLLINNLGKRASHSVISLRGKGAYGAPIQALGHDLHCLNIGGKTANLGVLKLRKVMRDIAPDLIQGWMYHGNIAAMMAQAFSPRQAEMVWNVRHSLYDIKAEKLGTQMAIRLGARLSNRAGKIIYNSKLSREQHERFGFASQPGTLIPNGFDPMLWKPDVKARADTRSALGIANEDLAIGFVGRNHAMKDLPNLLEALDKNMQDHPNLHAVIIGRDCGLTHPRLRDYYKSLDLRRVHILGQRSDIGQLLAGLDLFCLCSYGEGFPNVVGEAMATGVPCVVTDVGDAAGVVAETGVIVPTQSPQELAQGIDEILSLPLEKRHEMGRQARHRIKTTFSLTSTNDQYIDLYENLLDRQL